jgi:DNA polymerase-3 subunit delta
MSATKVANQTGSGQGVDAAALPVYLVKGDDPSLVDQAAHALCERLVAGGDPSLMIEEFGGPGGDHFDVGAAIDACTTPPFLVERRIVVVRDAGQLNAADAKRLVSYLEDPLPTTVVVLVGGGGAVPQALTKVVGAVGEVVDAAVGRGGKARAQWLAEHLSGGPVRLDGPAKARLSDHLGGDVGRLEGLLDTLASAYGTGATVTVGELEPFLGEAGSLAPWDLTDAIDAGQTAQALSVLHRMLGAGDSHPLVVMATLYRHYRQILRLDGTGGISAEQAAQILGIKSAYPAKKALAQTHRLGTVRIARAMQLLATADLDLRGDTMVPGPTVLEVLVARLSRLAPRGR